VTTRRLRDPEREKRLDLRERVDSWGEAPHSARRNVPLRYARLQRSYRRRVRQALLTAPDDVAVFRKEWRKWRSAERGDQIVWRREGRAALQAAPRKSAEARRRRSARRGRRPYPE